jgi:hypothetical protein
MFLLSIEEKYFEISTAPIENCCGFIQVMNRFHMSIHPHEK